MVLLAMMSSHPAAAARCGDSRHDVTVVVMLDGESTWHEGSALTALYAVIAAAN